MEKENIKMIKVESSSIEAMGWQDNILRIRFKGGATYDYEPFSSSNWVKICAAKSTGKFFYANIRHNKNIVCTQIVGKGGEVNDRKKGA